MSKNEAACTIRNNYNGRWVRSLSLAGEIVRRGKVSIRVRFEDAEGEEVEQTFRRDRDCPTYFYSSGGVDRARYLITLAE